MVTLARRRHYLGYGVTANIGPVVYGAQVQTAVPYGSGYYGNPPTDDIWKLAMNDGSGERFIFDSSMVSPDAIFHCLAPVWGTDMERILYTEVDISRTDPAITPSTRKLCSVLPDGTGRTIIYDTGQTYLTVSTSDIFQDYCMSPDGKKVAVTGPNSWLQCFFADGSGDCGGGIMSLNAYGNPQWSADSETIYITADVDGLSHGIVAFPFAGGSPTVIYGPNEFDYFFMSNDGTKFASAWYNYEDYDPSNRSVFAIIGVDGTPIHQYHANDCPWPDPYSPIVIFWAPDDSFLIMDQQARSLYPSAFHDGIALRTTPDLSDWMLYRPPNDPPNPPTNVTDRGILNWALALIDGDMKVIASVWNNYSTAEWPDYYGVALYQWDAMTGAQEGFLGPSGAYPDTAGHTGYEPGPVWDRYYPGGQPVCTDYYGTQAWDV